MIKLTIIQLNDLDEDQVDWWVLSRVEHEHKDWLESVESEYGDCKIFCTTRRVDPCDADIEGTKDEWLWIAHYIRVRGMYDTKRCAIKALETGFRIWSPRNSKWEHYIDNETALYLADQIERKLT